MAHANRESVVGGRGTRDEGKHKQEETRRGERLQLTREGDSRHSLSPSRRSCAPPPPPPSPPVVASRDAHLASHTLPLLLPLIIPRLEARGVGHELLCEKREGGGEAAERGRRQAGL